MLKSSDKLLIAKEKSLFQQTLITKEKSLIQQNVPFDCTHAYTLRLANTFMQPVPQNCGVTLEEEGFPVQTNFHPGGYGYQSLLNVAISVIQFTKFFR